MQGVRLGYLRWENVVKKVEKAFCAYILYILYCIKRKGKGIKTIEKW